LFRRVRPRFDESVAGMNERLNLVEQRLAEAGATAARLDAARAALNRSLAEARVLADAAGEAGDLITRIRSYVPR
jgi:hypothetical protein